ncbi:hypothetical protein [Stygiolobus caldivivus]
MPGVPVRGLEERDLAEREGAYKLKGWIRKKLLGIY